MRALYFDGSDLRLCDRPSPTLYPGEAIIRSRLAGICSTDIEICRGYMGFQGILGHEFVGVVESTESSGDAHWIGKRVVGTINAACGDCDMCGQGLETHCRNRTVLGIQNRDGCFAEHFQLPVRNLLEVPESIPDEAAVFAEPLAAAIQALRAARIEPGQTRAAIMGDGRLGLLTAQVFAQRGAVVTLIGKHPEKLLLGQQWGLATREVSQVDPQADFDVVVDCTASAKGLEMAMELVRPRGQIVMKTTVADPLQVNLAPIVINEIDLIGSRCGPFPDALDILERQLIDTESLISHRLPLTQALAAMELAKRPDTIKVLLEV